MYIGIGHHAIITSHRHRENRGRRKTETKPSFSLLSASFTQSRYTSISYHPLNPSIRPSAIYTQIPFTITLRHGIPSEAF